MAEDILGNSTHLVIRDPKYTLQVPKTPRGSLGRAGLGVGLDELAEQKAVGEDLEDREGWGLVEGVKRT